MNQTSTPPSDGGPAFPFDHKMGDCARGMTLRDYFAARALSLLVPASKLSEGPEIIARSAYLVADAMLKERAL